MHKMVRMNNKGDNTIATWTPDAKEKVEAEQVQFAQMIQQGYAAFAKQKGSEEAKQVKVFDPDSEVILFVAPMVGG